MISSFTREFGRGARDVHLIHCSLASGKAWAPLAAELEADCAMVAVDMLGQGRSQMPDPDAEYMAQCALSSIAVIEGQGGAVDLVGHSFGACVALKIAVMRPDLLRSLVLFEPVFFGFLNDAGLDAFAQMEKSEEPYYSAMTEGRMLDAAAAFMTRWGMPGQWAAMPKEAQQGFAEKMWVIQAQQPSIISENDIRLRLADLGAIDVRCLVMHGEDSPSVMANMTEVISAAMPHAQGDSLAGAGHMLPITHAKECAAKLRVFWTAA